MAHSAFRLHFPILFGSYCHSVYPAFRVLHFALYGRVSAFSEGRAEQWCIMDYVPTMSRRRKYSEAVLVSCSVGIFSMPSVHLSMVAYLRLSGRQNSHPISLVSRNVARG